MNIKELTIEQLKAIKCDQYENIQRSQMTIQAVNAEIERRALEAAVSTKQSKKQANDKEK